MSSTSANISATYPPVNFQRENSSFGVSRACVREQATHRRRGVRNL
jgi:hypothetical protein